MILTPRARLRRFHAGDFFNYRLLDSDVDVMRFTPARMALPAERTQARLDSVLALEAERAPLGVWAAELGAGSGSGEFVGWFMVLKTEFAEPELGFMIVRRFWGTGLATELCSALIEHVRGLGFPALTAVVDADNPASIRVLEKLGFVRVGESKPGAWVYRRGD